jgi:hypothetical protein
MNGKLYFEQDTDTLPSGNIDISELEVGRMIVPDPDCWMLGSRWVIENVDDDSITVQSYQCGKKYPWNPVKMLKSTLLKWWMRDEWFDEWKRKFENKII